MSNKSHRPKDSFGATTDFVPILREVSTLGHSDDRHLA